MSTSISHLVGPGNKKPPAVFWRKQANQYMSYIGYRRATKGKNKGQRVRTPHYLGRDHREALLSAILIDRRWDRVIEEDKRRVKLIENVVGPRRVKPLWPTDEQKRIREASVEELEQLGLLINLPPEEGEVRTYLTIAQLVEQFLMAQKGRIGLQGRRGLKPGTFSQLVRNINSGVHGINTSMNVLDLTREDCRKLVDYWLSPERGVTERTAGNYCRAFKRMIDWADNESICGFVKPKIGDLFSFANTPGHIERFDPEQIKALLAVATERCRLYILLGLNTGMNQIDVANLSKDEIIEINGEMFIGRRRCKTSHQNDFRTLHFVWPEVWELLKKHLAADNAENLALLNVNGRKLKRGKTDNIRDSMNEVREASGVRNVTYKQLRKFGITAIKRITLNPEIARMYAAQKIVGVLAHYDRDDFFDPLTSALKSWQAELLSQGVLTTGATGEGSIVEANVRWSRMSSTTEAPASSAFCRYSLKIPIVFGYRRTRSRRSVVTGSAELAWVKWASVTCR
jgi:hypothetical protein